MRFQFTADGAHAIIIEPADLPLLLVAYEQRDREGRRVRTPDSITVRPVAGDGALLSAFVA